MATGDQPTTEKHTAGAFDIRRIIGLLLGIYGVILTVIGLFFVSDTELDKSDGFNINLVIGIALIVVSAFFFVWARLRPIVVEDAPAEAHDDTP
ncbi:hypothetical protein CLV56_3425 [Mumia flava]|uniref:Uncharacterized protein n=1 Tax=Mumia flava TaxID=1348852 RepID=A0A0B2BBT3_9ACTN|nr:hypothetical protein [Mumia flava]PJJ53923.1 hypothetical protein CLV56_3425 [Mumia flava]